jgi:membrane-associated phospholipid phosphatase
MAQRNGKTGLLADLAARREKYASDAPPIYWKSWAVITLVLIAIAMIWRDGALTIAARSEPDWLRAIAQHTTNFGKSGWILVLSGVIFIVSWLALRRSGPTGPSSRVRYYATASGYMFLSVALSGIISNLVKRTIGRGRPPVFDEFGAFHFHPFAGNSLYESLPSGHSTTDGAIFMVLAVLCPKYRVPLLVIGFLFAMTRIMVGAHYLSDVIAGYSFGMWYAYMSAIVFARHGFFLDARRQA